MFERFLNPGRIDPPDIDVDFAWDERDDVLDYVFEKHGPEHAAMVATHLSFGTRMAVREVARVYGLTEQEISTVTRKLPQFVHDDHYELDLNHLLTHMPQTKGLTLDPPWPEVIGKAQRLLGMPCGIGTHCGGVVITSGPIKRHAPVQYSAKGYPIVQWEKDGAEDMGLVKIDLLGNRSLAVIRDAIKNLRREGVRFDESRWSPADDQASIDLLASGRTMGVFYVESPAMRLLQEKARVGDFDHMVIHSSIIRPAANKYTREYIRRLHGERYVSEHPLLDEVLRETYGIMVYQEDVSRVAVQLAGFSCVDADGLRKVMAKKARGRKLEDYERAFVEGARARGVTEEKIRAIWNMMMSFSGYSFCKPHSASYVQVSFQSAYLKAHHPAAFMAAVISNFGGFYTTQAYVSEAQRLGVRILPPDVNLSELQCVSEGMAIRIGLCLIKGLSDEGRKRVLEERGRGGCYASLDELLRRTWITEGDGERLIYAGACDSLMAGECGGLEGNEEGEGKAGVDAVGAPLRVGPPSALSLPASVSHGPIALRAGSGDTTLPRTLQSDLARRTPFPVVVSKDSAPSLPPNIGADQGSRLDHAGMPFTHDRRPISHTAPSLIRPRLFWALRRHFRSAGMASPADTPDLPPYTDRQLLGFQYRALGFLAGHHPIQLARPRDAGKALPISQLRSRIGSRVEFYGWCVTSRTLTTTNSEGMAFVTFEDETGLIETVLFPQAYVRFAHHIAWQEAFLVRGRVTQDLGAAVVEADWMEPAQRRECGGQNTGDGTKPPGDSPAAKSRLSPV